ncbi:MmcQ family protein [Streptococcus suis]|uniref:Cytoplasmic protein n=1 Tax=Streptococcus suis TaxID=1307 RepID=A0A116QGI4_STRSU|nr:MmcQ/YjbR family DNA-binding protein [Streptococcus suis]NQN59774.1 MmcQ family protein [Streptococcus suis]NQP74159.1 MmcQ family protein [Streptococcus suis]NQP76171.1 MmcQ family protein [Streptococcus suis]NQP91074.1 MmcQ family protein [Streptococcus suis]NQP92474.1 MmcQ family protein [Streptococcus suis]
MTNVNSKLKVHLPSLIPFGFILSDNRYTYREVFMEGQFEAVVEVDEAGQLSSFVWDCEMEEVYTAHLVTAPAGAFVGQVREAYQSILDRVEEACCVALPFSKDQSNRIAQLIKEKWGDLPDYPFAKSPETGSFRHPSNNKWYALVTQVKRGQLDGSADQELVEIVNLKVDGREIAELLSQSGIYPAYHMSKKAWVSVLLDETVEDQMILALLEKSRYLVGPKSYKAEQGPDYWVIPANPKVYDIDTEFAENKVVYWPQKSTIQAGDIVAIYVTAPVQAIRYVCRVLGANLENHGQPDIPTDKKIMQVELIAQLPDDVLPRARMMDLGVRAVRGPRRLTEGVIEVLTSEVKNLH